MSSNSKDMLMNEVMKLSVVIKDYWAEPSVEHIEQWLQQFERTVRLPLIAELGHILSKTYFSAERVRGFLKELITTTQLVGADPAKFWQRANFFTAQQGGSSQGELLDV